MYESPLATSEFLRKILLSSYTIIGSDLNSQGLKSLSKVKNQSGMLMLGSSLNKQFKAQERLKFYFLHHALGCNKQFFISCIVLYLQCNVFVIIVRNE